MDLLVAVDKLDDLVFSARPVPMTDQVRMRPERLAEAVADVRAAAPPGRSDLHHVVARLEALFREAKPIPLTGQVRLDKDRVYELLDELRAMVPGPPA